MLCEFVGKTPFVWPFMSLGICGMGLEESPPLPRSCPCEFAAAIFGLLPFGIPATGPGLRTGCIPLLC